ncbi:MAG: AsmA family protein [Alphaproteobacteria bacterium]|nr:AsmA family protein [Alphaproteobacteria bacterium]
MKFFGRKNSKKDNVEELKTEESLTTIVKEEATENKETLAKIEPVKVDADKAIDGFKTIDDTQATDNLADNQTPDISPKKPKSEFEQKVDNVIASVAQLFAPFKELMLKIIPASKWIIKPLDYLAIGIAKLTKLIILRYPLFIKFLKSFYFKAIVIFLAFLFIFGAIFSKIVNSNYYITSIEDAIYKSTGFQAKINGLIKVSFVPSLSITLNNVSFFVEESTNTNSSQFKVSQFDAANLRIDFKFLPLFVGNFSIKNIEILGATLNLQTADSTSLQNLNYNQIIEKVEQAIKSNMSSHKLQEITEKATPTDNKSNGNEVLDLLDNLESLIKNGSDSTQQTPATTPKEEVPAPAVEEESQEKEAVKEETQPQAEPSEPEVDNTPSGALIAPKEDTSMKYGFLSRALATIVNNVSFSFNDVDNFLLRRSRINIINNQSQRILSIENITAKVSSSLSGKITATGSLRFADSNIEYNSIFNYEKERVNFTVDFILDGRTNDIIKLKGYKNQQNGEIVADLSMENQGILLFINKFLFEINSKKIQNSNFTGKLILNSNFLKIDNMNIAINDNTYRGSFTWDFSGNAKNVVIDIIAEMKDMSQITQGISSTINNSVIKDSTFLAVIEEITNWKNAKMNIFRPNHFVVNFKVENTVVNNIPLDSFSVGFLLDNFDKVYIYNLSAQAKEYNADVMGRIDLDSKTALLSLQSKGSISKAGSTLGFNQRTIEFLQNIGKSQDIYDISSKLRLENNKLLFTDFTGNLGNLQLNDTYIIYTQRLEDSDILVSTKIDQFNLEDITSIYNKQISNLTYERIEDVNIFGLSNNLKVKINMDIAKSKFRGVPFKNVNLDISLFKTGFTINRFSAIGERGGSLTGSISADSIVLPVIAGHINVENLVLVFEDTKDLFFKNTPLVGNVVLNGRIKFNGDSFDKAFSTIDGDLTFIKQERINVNRLANIDGLFLTLSQKKVNGKNTIFVNDIYGRADIKNNRIELYPIALLYFDSNNKEYRGVSQVIIDLGEQSIKGEGSGEQTADTRNKFKLTLSGNFLNPTIKNSFFRGEKSTTGVKPVEKDITLVNKKTHKVVDNLNNTKDKNNFNNTYNSNISNKSHDDLKNKLYDDLLDDNTKGKATYPNSQDRKPSSGNITKGQDNTQYYGNNN